MAEISIPPPDASGRWYFTYRTTDPETGQWYGGKRSTKRHPLTDAYRGSGLWVLAHPERRRLTREIVAFHATAAEAYAAEREMITCSTILGDPLCMNLCEGGDGTSPETFLDPVFRATFETGVARRTADPKWLESNRAAAKLRSTNPAWRANQIVGAAKRLADPTWHKANKAATRIRSTNPKWQKNQRAAMLLVYADPKWRENHLAGVAKRTANPTWHANVAASNISRATVLIEVNGERVPLSEVCRKTGISYKLASMRRLRGKPESEWLLPPRKSR